MMMVFMGLDLDESPLHREHGSFRAGVDAEFGEDVPDVGLMRRILLLHPGIRE